jgi:oligopeptide/dipeptide ABC transporter ATP-binding protein
MAGALLDVQHLTLSFQTFEGRVQALDRVSLSIREGEIFGLLGESGCGKSVTALATMGLLPRPQAVLEGGRIRFEGQDLTRLSERGLRAIRGNRIGMIFQEPMTALNPVMTVGKQIEETLLLHEKTPPRLAKRMAVAKLREVGIPDASEVAGRYAHELSGGMRQRVMIAMMMACEPKLLIADEPTTALDVTIQAQILDLMRALREKRGAAIWLISHDIGVIGEMCDTIAVMYAGSVVEKGTRDQILQEPRHPYTIGLLEAVPKIGGVRGPLPVIPGKVPNLLRPPSGCRFHPRCPLATSRCARESPPLVPVDSGQFVACHHADKTSGGLLGGRSFAEASKSTILAIKEGA